MILAADIGGSNMRFGLVSHDKIIVYKKIKTPKNKKVFLDGLVSELKKLDNKQVKGIGIGIPGPLNNGHIINPPNIPLKNFNLSSFIKQKLRKKVVIENDANCVALAESVYGCRKKNFIVMTLGTGIGGGIIIEGELYKGQGNAGEFGHLIINNQYLEKIWQENRHSPLKSAEKIADALASLVNVFDPETVILAGGVENKSELLDLVKKEYVKKCIVPHRVPIMFTRLKHPGILGASLLI